MKKILGQDKKNNNPKKDLPENINDLIRENTHEGYLLGSSGGRVGTKVGSG